LNLGRITAEMLVIEYSDPERQAILAEARHWWLRLLWGMLFLVLGFVIFGYDADSLTVLSIFIGVSFLLSSLTWLLMGLVAVEGRGFWLVGGVLGLAAAIVAFAYPDETLRVLSLMLGWFLLLAGLVQFVGALRHRDRELWWVSLIFGIVVFGLGAWAVGETDRSLTLLATIVGIYCVLKGALELIVAMRLRSLKHHLIRDVY
jgi:uncharacterized membrane protein HdeD (DUF308 family)